MAPPAFPASAVNQQGKSRLGLEGHLAGHAVAVAATISMATGRNPSHS
jgi:hypothetical protein